MFKIDNPVVIENLLGAMYIDQDKGWSLLNRGKTIGTNMFNVESFLSGLCSKDYKEIENKINIVESKIQRYKTLLDISEFKRQQNDLIKEDKQFNSLINSKNYYEMLISEKEKIISQLQCILKNNETIGKIIDSYNFLVKHNNSEFVLTSKNIVDYDINQNIIKSKISLLNIEINNIKKELVFINDELNSYYNLVNVEDRADSAINKILDSGLDQEKLSTTIDKLKKEKSILNDKKISDLKNNNLIIGKLANHIQRISEKLNIFEEYVKTEGDYIFTHNLKSYSGAILHKMVFAYRLSYLLLINELYNISLPFIIDSPGSNEMTLENLKLMLNVLNEEKGKNQIIVSSIFSDEMEFRFENKIDIYNGIFSNM